MNCDIIVLIILFRVFPLQATLICILSVSYAIVLQNELAKLQVRFFESFKFRFYITLGAEVCVLVLRLPSFAQ